VIFDHRNIDEISDDEFAKLVSEHYVERQHIEFKVTVNIRDEADRVEVLKDISSMANGGGGYIIIGIKEDGKGKAVQFEPTLVGNTDGIAKSIRSLSLDGIQDRIEGIDIQLRNIAGNPIVVIRVPSSTRTPHMVSYNQRAEFYSRYQDGKRAMSMSEIREMFNRDDTIRRLKFIEEKFTQLTSHSPQESALDNDTAVLAKQEAAEQHKDRLATNFAKTGEVILPEGITGEMAQEIYFETFKKRFGDKPMLWLSATPAEIKNGVVDPFDPEILKLIQTMPGTRSSGWNIGRIVSKWNRFTNKIVRGDLDYGEISLDSYAHLEFWTHLDETFCDFQTENEFKERPRLYPYAVTEHPVSFLRLYKTIIDQAKLTGDILIAMRWRNLKGYVLPPYSPKSIIWGFKDRYSEPFKQEHFEPVAIRVSHDFDPELTGLKLLETLYTRFGLNITDIPFFEADKKQFVW